LATAYAAIGLLPERCRLFSNQADIARLLRHRLGANWKTKAHQARHVLSEAEWGSEKKPLPFNESEHHD
jgi:hypothetical protein